MSITDELRKWARQFRRVWVDPHSGDLTYITNEHACPPSLDAVRLEDYITAIADRIDAEHEKELRYDRAAFWHEAGWDELKEYGLKRGTLDADGVMWCMGEKFITPNGEVKTVWITGDNAIVTDDHEFYYHANKLRHYHAPTVEDELTDLCEHVWEAALLGGTWSDSPVESYIADFASRLQLREDA